jgi:hypothetical protein
LPELRLWPVYFIWGFAVQLGMRSLDIIEVNPMNNILSGLIPCCKIMEIDALLFQVFDHDKAFGK